MQDRYGREIDYMRISVTDRCNLRCVYCMPHGTVGTGRDCLNDDEIVTTVRAAAGLGIRYLRLTGGEPLLRPGLTGLIRRLSGIEGIETIDLTTNGILLAERAGELFKAGLNGVNVSLDTTDEAVFAAITGCKEIAGYREDSCGNECNNRNRAAENPFSAESVLKGIDAAAEAGLKTKINCVLTEINRDSWQELTKLTCERCVDVRFIELMPIGSGKEHTGISNEFLMRLIAGRYGEPETVSKPRGHGPARYFRLPGAKGCIGFVSAVHGKFCDFCNRIRLTSEGVLKPCLCYDSDIDLKSILRKGATADELAKVICEAILNKPKAHCFEMPGQISEIRSMSQIGG